MLTGHGGLDKLESREDWPTPRAGPGKAVARGGARGLNNRGVNARTAWYSKCVTEGVDVARVGERVMTDPWLLGVGDWLDPHRSAYFGDACDGGYAEFTKCAPALSWRPSLAPTPTART